jgi:transcriptional regulator with XRE-family HTH domain
MGMSQSQLAERSGLWVQQISAYERGKNTPAGENLKLLAQALSVTIDWLLSADDTAHKLPPLPAPEHKKKRTASAR